jgi:hypothetical protein
MSVVTVSDGEWITGLAARRRLKCSYGALQRLAVLGQVRTRLALGVPVRYRREDVEAIAAQTVASGQWRVAREDRSGEWQG